MKLCEDLSNIEAVNSDLTALGAFLDVVNNKIEPRLRWSSWSLNSTYGCQMKMTDAQNRWKWHIQTMETNNIRNLTDTSNMNNFRYADMLYHVCLFVSKTYSLGFVFKAMLSQIGSERIRNVFSQQSIIWLHQPLKPWFSQPHPSLCYLCLIISL